MRKEHKLPFKQWILPVEEGKDMDNKCDIPPPLYERKVGFVFPLKPLLKDPTTTLNLNSTLTLGDHLLVQQSLRTDPLRS